MAATPCPKRAGSPNTSIAEAAPSRVAAGRGHRRRHALARRGGMTPRPRRSAARRCDLPLRPHAGRRPRRSRSPRPTAERDAIATFLEVSEIPRLEVDLTALPFRGGIRVSGRLKAEVVQPCVVTFVPVRQEIDEPIDRIFLPGREKPTPAPGKAEVFVDLEERRRPGLLRRATRSISPISSSKRWRSPSTPIPGRRSASLEDVLPPDDDAEPLALRRPQIPQEPHRYLANASVSRRGCTAQAFEYGARRPEGPVSARI